MNQLEALNSPSGSQSKYEEKKIDTLDQQPPPPGFESELNTELPDNNLFTNLPTVTEMKEVKGNVLKKVASDDENVEKLKNHTSLVVSSKNLKNLPSTTVSQTKRRHGSREKKRDSSSDDAKKDKKSRDKKKRKKSKDVDKKKNKKDRKDKGRRSEKDKWEQKSENGYQVTKDALVDGSNLITSTTTQSTANIMEKTNDSVNSKDYEADSSQTDFIGEEKEEVHRNQLLKEKETENYDDNPNTKPDSPSVLNHSDSILDIYSNMDYDMEFPEWSAPEISRWERDENNTSLNPALNVSQNEADKCEMDEKNKPLDEKVTTEIIKRAENAIFTR